MATSAAKRSGDSSLLDLTKRSIRFAYRCTFRRLLPDAGPIRYSGIAISKDKKWGDLSIPSFMAPYRGQDIPNYEAALIKALRSTVRLGDRVVVVGGGEGVTAVIAAQCTGSKGTVICFEGDETSAKNVRTTAERNGVHELIKVKDAIVAKDIGVYNIHNSKKSPRIVAPKELPPCDVLELDCEGAEIEIINNIEFVPRAILVETHGVHGAPTEEVRKLLEVRGYHVDDLGWAEPNRLDDCINSDIRVLSARRDLA